MANPIVQVSADSALSPAALLPPAALSLFSPPLSPQPASKTVIVPASNHAIIFRLYFILFPPVIFILYPIGVSP